MKNIFCLALIKRNVFLYVGVVLFLSMVLATSVNATQYYVGDGSEGALTISSTRTEDSVKSNITAQANSGQKNVTVNSTSGFATGDLVFIIQMQGTGAGNYEFNRVDSISGNTLTMRTYLVGSYQSTGAQVIKVFEYSSSTVNSGGSWQSSDWDGTTGGVLVAVVTNNITVNSGGYINQDAKGFQGGTTDRWFYGGYQGESPTGKGATSSPYGGVANGMGGGGAHGDNHRALGGGGGGHGTNGEDGSVFSDDGSVWTFGAGKGGNVGGFANLENGNLLLGGGGGGGFGGWSACNDNGGGKGGDAGGIIFLISGGNITINNTVSSNGASGTTNCDGRMGGGGGTGGAIRLLLSGTLTLGTENVKAIGGSAVGSSAAGGAGGVGRIATLSSATISGTSNPTIDTSSTDTTTTTDPFAAALPPTVTTSSASNVTSTSATLNGTVNANGLSTTAWFNYGIASGTYTGTSTTQSVSGSSNTTVSIGISRRSSSTTYYYRIAASNSGGTAYGNEASFTTSAVPTPTSTPTPTDTTAPTNTSITINSGASYTNSTTVTVTLLATDTVGVTGYYLSTNLSTPIASASGWNSVTSTTSYSGSASYPLTSGDENKTIYAWFKDSQGNVSSTASDSIILDTTAPIVTITSPTSGDTYTATGSTVSLSGNASDSLSGVSSVTWSNDKGGRGVASGTTYWSISNISLSSGDNKITVTAKDSVGNTSTDTITVTYTASTAPTVKTGSATNVTTNSATLSGTVNANGLSTTAWFEYGTLSGLYGSKSSTQTVIGSNDTTVSITITGLTSGTTYYYKIVAENNSGKSEGSEMSFQYTQSGNAPTVETEAATDITNTTAKLNGKCNPNGQSTTAWFEYGTLSGTYNYQTSTQSISGSSYTNVGATITGLTVGTKYYYRIAAQNSAGTSYGSEMSFYKSTDTQTTPTPQTSPTPAPTPVPTPTATEKGVIVGTVADGAAGVGIGGAKIISDKGGYSATTGFDGSYTIENVSAGDYTLTASADGYKSSSQAVTVYADEVSAADFILTRESGGIVFGFVLDENGDSLEGVTIAITGRGNNQLQSTETDDDGYYEFRDLEAGEYTLTFEKGGYRTQTLDIILEVEEALEAETITMELEVKGSIFGYVVDIYGDPIESVRLKLKGIKTKIKRNASSDADGFFEFADLDADKYVVFASKKRYKKTKQTVSLDEGDEQEIQIEMRKSSSSRRIIPEAEE